MKDDIKQFINEEILDESDGVQLEVEDDLLTSGLIDSIGMMRIVAFVEETADVQIPPEDVTIETFRTIDAIAAYVTERKNSDG